MTDLELPTTLYFSLCLGPGGYPALLGDIHYDEPTYQDMSAEDRAYDEWVEAIAVFDPRPRAFRVDLDVTTNAPETIREVTDDFYAERTRLLRQRGLWFEDDE
jgi:hypothetical protein